MSRLGDWAKRTFRNDLAESAPKTQLAPASVPRQGFETGIPAAGLTEQSAAAGSGKTDRQTQMADLYDAFLACPWSWTATNAIARTITAGGLGFKWDRDDGEGDQAEPAKPLPVLQCEKLLAFVNPREDIIQLLRSTVADLEVFGDAFIEVVWAGGIPVALYTLDCPSTSPVADPHGNVTGYVQVTDQQQKATFEVHEVIHISLDAPRSGIFGVAPTMAALLPIKVWLFAQATLKEIFRKGMPANLWVDHPQSMSPVEQGKWTDQHMTRNVGPMNIGRPVVTKGGANVHELQQSKVDEILHVLDQQRDDILACVTPDTMVFTCDGLAAIENMKPGMQVLTHTGRWKTVTEVMVNPAYKPVVEIRANSFAPLRATTNHPVWAAEYKQTRRHEHIFQGHRWVSAGYLKPRVRNCRGASDALTIPALDLTANTGILHCADHLTLGDRNTSFGYVTQRAWDDGTHICHSSRRVRSIPSEVKMDHGLGRLLGLYLAEGFQGREAGVCWAFHEDETHLHEEVCKQLADSFGLMGASTRRGIGRGVYVYVCNMFLGQLLNCGKALDKRLPNWAWNGTAEFFEGVLSGWNDGDGKRDIKNGKDGLAGPRTAVTTKSQTLAWQMRVVAATLGLPTGLGMCDSETINDQFIGKYALRSNGPTHLVGWPLEAQRKGTYRVEDGALVSPIREIESIDYHGLVYNLEVEDDHSFVTTSGTVHNCYGVPPAQAGVIESGNLGGGTGEAQRKMFETNTCQPVAALILEKINFLLTRAFGIEGWSLHFNTVDMRDSKTIEDIRDTRVRNGAWTLDRYRTEIGEPPVDGGDAAVLVDRQNIVLWRDMGALSTAGIAFKLKGTALEPAGQPGDQTNPDEPVTLQKTTAPAPQPEIEPDPATPDGEDPGLNVGSEPTGPSGDAVGGETWRPSGIRESYRARLAEALRELPHAG